VVFERRRRRRRVERWEVGICDDGWVMVGRQLLVIDG